MAKNKKDKIRETEVTENLKCDLTDDEVSQAAETLARLIQSTVGLEKDKKSAMASFKAKIDAAQAGIIDQSNKVRDKYEYRDVDCVRHMNFTTHVTKTTRNDTGDVFDDRKMSVAEKLDQNLFDSKAT